MRQKFRDPSFIQHALTESHQGSDRILGPGCYESTEQTALVHPQRPKRLPWGVKSAPSREGWAESNQEKRRRDGAGEGRGRDAMLQAEEQHASTPPHPPPRKHRASYTGRGLRRGWSTGWGQIKPGAFHLILTLPGTPWNRLLTHKGMMYTPAPKPSPPSLSLPPALDSRPGGSKCTPQPSALHLDMDKHLIFVWAEGKIAQDDSSETESSPSKKEGDMHRETLPFCFQISSYRMQ